MWREPNAITIWGILGIVTEFPPSDIIQFRSGCYQDAVFSAAHAALLLVVRLASRIHREHLKTLANGIPAGHRKGPLATPMLLWISHDISTINPSWAGHKPTWGPFCWNQELWTTKWRNNLQLSSTIRQIVLSCYIIYLLEPCKVTMLLLQVLSRHGLNHGCIPHLLLWDHPCAQKCGT